MPIVKWACPPDKPTYGEAHDAEYCIKECKDRCVSPHMIAALTRSTQVNHHYGPYISATSLDGCSRKLLLERTEDYYEYMQNVLYGFRGTIIHSVVEEAANFTFPSGESLADIGYLSEYGMLLGFCFSHGGFAIPAEVSPYKEETWALIQCPSCDENFPEPCFLLGGTCDGLEPHWDTFEHGVLTCTLWDMKTLNHKNIQAFIKGEKKNIHHAHIKDPHFMQAHIYKYLLERTPIHPALEAKGVERIVIKEAHIQSFGMNEFPRTGTNYRQKVRGKDAGFKDTFIPGVQFKSDQWVEAYIKERGYPIYMSLIRRETRGEVVSPDQSWLCNGFCPFNGSDLCPNPKVEWEAIHKDGFSAEDAFKLALRNQL